MVRFVPSSLRTRLALVFGIGTSLVLLIALSLLYVVLDRQLDGAVDADLAGRGDDLIAGIRSGDLTTVSGDPMAQLYAPDGTLIASGAALSGQVLLLPDQVRSARNHTVKSVALLDLRPDEPALRVRLMARPTGRDGDILAVAQPLATVESAGNRQLIVLAVATPVLIGALAVLGWLLVRAALRPVDLLTREAAAISTFDTDRRLPVITGDDEIGRLAATLGGMLSRLSVAFTRERAFVDDASHELRTPIAVLRGELDLALAAVDDPAEVRRSLLAAQNQVARLTRLAEDMLLLARERAGALAVHREPVDLTDLAHTEQRALATVSGLRIEVRGDPVIVDADPGRVRQILANLAANSGAAGATTAQVTIVAEEAGARIQWADDGPGFPHELLDRAFERFVRGDRSRTSATGAGLGLSIVRAVTIAHGGTAEVRNGPPLGGAVVTVHLPTK
ncbi:integral membrane sensor signal transduction histidine kinase [Actinoplanes sp. SE50]|uniref:sensor histidine kinase n=1 Tax=unclassified Actinoplanes TaxID=2626549 RepID=UPI00023EC7B9|nr:MULTISPECIES: ATP-binding protein [unclassified Actinoplanes]AEV84223.1 integral membrane sensor signal transduction histidine kinase [Actinoplanes sp. SE50/110]ATO82615.1 integral membrane sensor signal transduction histidine kinase [Actinoplanes sp. SE50]SLM00022.1 two-component sensor histidine kinase [Actinoplanes sp. SE50/110]